LIVVEEFIVVLLEKRGTQRLVFGQQVSESEKGVRCNVESGQLDIVKELVELFRVDDQLGQLFVPTALSQHHAAIQRYLGYLVAIY